jgi:general stress protein 26
MIIIIII